MGTIIDNPPSAPSQRGFQRMTHTQEQLGARKRNPVPDHTQARGHRQPVPQQMPQGPRRGTGGSQSGSPLQALKIWALGLIQDPAPLSSESPDFSSPNPSADVPPTPTPRASTPLKPLKSTKYALRPTEAALRLKQQLPGVSGLRSWGRGARPARGRGRKTKGEKNVIELF